MTIADKVFNVRSAICSAYYDGLEFCGEENCKTSADNELLIFLKDYAMSIATSVEDISDTSPEYSPYKNQYISVELLTFADGSKIVTEKYKYNGEIYVNIHFENHYTEIEKL